uniref:Uncharacterized protein n=1 Tax=Mantoniella antarctica TaxID=81844 RepID=A0A7S0SGH7_9CHLO
MLAQLTTHVPPPSVRVRRLAIGGIAASALPPRPCAAAAGRRRGRIPSALPGMMPAHLHDVVARDAHYGSGGDAPINTAQYLLDLDTGATLNFCGGMMFGLALSPMLRQHLHDVSKGGAGDSRQPVVYGTATRRMAMRPGYTQDASADNATVFHGREVRKVPDAAGGMGFVIHLSFAGESTDGGGAAAAGSGPSLDPQGWTRGELDEYSGWLSDQQRRWRDRTVLEGEGFESFGATFGPDAFTLHHRFYLHSDRGGAMWLAAEDGCEGTPAPPAPPARDYPKEARNAFSFFK